MSKPSPAIAEASSYRRWFDPPFYDELNAAVACGFHVCLNGPRGTGKTTAIKELASGWGKKLHVIQVHADLTIEELRGEPGLREGNSTFQRSPVVVAAERGDWVLFDEANLARPGVTAWMNNVLDDDGVVSIPATGELIPVARAFRCFFSWATREHVSSIRRWWTGAA